MQFQSGTHYSDANDLAGFTTDLVSFEAEVAPICAATDVDCYMWFVSCVDTSSPVLSGADPVWGSNMACNNMKCAAPAPCLHDALPWSSYTHPLSQHTHAHPTMECTPRAREQLRYERANRSDGPSRIHDRRHGARHHTAR